MDKGSKMFNTLGSWMAERVVEASERSSRGQRSLITSIVLVGETDLVIKAGNLCRNEHLLRLVRQSQGFVG